MKSLSRILIICFVLLAFTVIASPVRAGSATFSVTLTTSSPSSEGVFTGTPPTGVILGTFYYNTQAFYVDAAGTYTIQQTSTSTGGTDFVIYIASFNPSSVLTNAITSQAGLAGSPLTSTIALKANTTYIFLTISNHAGDVGVYTNTISGPGNVFLTAYTAPGGFNPTDGRIDARPGDRISVYCNQPDKVIVWGIADDQPANMSGFYLTTFSYKTILAAGNKGLTNSLGAKGSVSVSLIKGWFWIAWNGGKYHATGQGDFHKNFSDDLWCGSAHASS